MISDRCSYAYRKVLVKRIGEQLLPSAQSWGLLRTVPSGSGHQPQETIMIVPALLILLGDKSWWPSQAVRVPGAAAAQEPLTMPIPVVR